MKTPLLLGLLLASSLFAVPEGGVPVPLRTGNTTLPIGATFLDRYRDLSDTQWRQEFDEMRRHGISHVFIVSAGTLGASPGTIESPIYPSAMAAQSGARDLLGLWLQFASERDMFIHVGSLQTRGDWTTGAEFVNLRATNMAMYREIIQRYRSHKSLVGAYFAQELWANWALTEKLVNGRDYPGSIVASEFIRDIRQLRLETGKGLTTSFAPVFKKQAQGAMRGLAPIELGNAMVEILRLAKFDLAMLQDGIGVGTQTAAPLAELGQYMQQARAGADSTGTEFWSTVEVFTDDQNIAWGSAARPRHAFRPGSIDRIAQQIAAAAPHVRGMCMWTFGDHLSSMATYEPVAARALASAYRARYDSRFSSLILVQPISYQYQYGLKPHESLPDSMWPPKLTDLRGLGYNAFIGENPDTGWNNQHGPDAGVGFLPSTANTNTKPLFEFLPNTKVGRIEIQYKTGLGAIAPSTLEAVEVSDNGINWTTVLPQSRVRPATDAKFGVTWSVMNINAQGRYVRITIPFAKVGWYVIGEVRFFGERDPNPPTHSLTITSLDKPPATKPWFVPGDKVKVRWNLTGPKVEGSNTWIVLESDRYGFRSVDFEQKVICGTPCGVFLATKGAITHNGENFYEFVIPQVMMGPTFRVGIITMGPDSVYHWLSSTETIDVIP